MMRKFVPLGQPSGTLKRIWLSWFGGSKLPKTTKEELMDILVDYIEMLKTYIGDMNETRRF